MRDYAGDSSCGVRKTSNNQGAGITNIRDDKGFELDTLSFNLVIRALVEPHGRGVMRSAAQPAKSNYEEVRMEARIARLESDVSHIQKDVAEIKVDLKSLQAKVEAGFTEIRQSIAQLSVAMEKAYGKSKVEMIGTRVWALSTLGGILLIMAKAFKWI